MDSAPTTTATHGAAESPGEAETGRTSGERPESDRAERPHPGSVWRSRPAWMVLIVTIALSVGIDLVSKDLAFRYVAQAPVPVVRERVIEVSTKIDARAITEKLIPPHPPRVVVPDLLHFTLVLNPGAVFGMGPGQRGFFITFTLAALGFGVYMFGSWTRPRDFVAHASIGMLIGGGLGNLYDRLVYACVRDFIHPLPGWVWPRGWKPLGDPAIWPYVSNLADLFLLIGIIMLLIYLWKRDRAAAT